MIDGLRFGALLVLTGSMAAAQAPSVPPVPAAASAGGDSVPMALTMDAAVALAQRNNPSYLQTVGSQRSAAAALRSTYGGLMPQLSASLGGGYQQGGQQILSGSALNVSSAVLNSNYNIGLTYTVGMSTLLAPRQARANLAAAAADITGARETLRATVRQDYLTAQESEDGSHLQDTLVANARVQLELAKARAAVGSGTALDVQKAEVALGQQQVQQLQAQNQAAIDLLRLFQQIGVPAPARVTLTTAVSQVLSVPPLDALIAMAQQQNPGIQALRLRTQAASVGVSIARSAYTPTVSLGTGIGGYTYQYRDANFLIGQQQAGLAAQQASCIQQQQILSAVGLASDPSQCAAYTFTPAQASAIRAQNDVFPFHFTQTPRSISLSISVPLFDGFVREQRVQDADVQWDNARAQERERSLALTADVTAAYLTLQNARQTVALQTQNSAKAHQELQYSQDQYAVGLATFVDLTTSRAAYAQAESDRITAVYNYHKALAALESSVGRPLQ
ncbi:MAG TPA: TolC family protein [Gemmatimonadaceae bacterium]|jgi:outer membrane protein|nr:TolC family protein [Gemmatimonadaceae bacterium]